MCLYLSKENNNRIIAEKDIICWKVMYPNYDKDKDADYLSFYRNFPYKANSEYSGVELIPIDYYDAPAYGMRYIINKGYHSYIKKSDATRVSGYGINVVVKCRIPAGAKYYIGMNGDYVSDKIVIGKMIFRDKILRIFRII